MLTGYARSVYQVAFFYGKPDWIFRCIVRHDSATKYATHSGAKYASIPLERLPIIPLQSTPLR